MIDFRGSHFKFRNLFLACGPALTLLRPRVGTRGISLRLLPVGVWGPRDRPGLWTLWTFDELRKFGPTCSTSCRLSVLMRFCGELMPSCLLPLLVLAGCVTGSAGGYGAVHAPWQCPLLMQTPMGPLVILVWTWMDHMVCGVPHAPGLPSTPPTCTVSEIPALPPALSFKPYRAVHACWNTGCGLGGSPASTLKPGLAVFKLAHAPPPPSAPAQTQHVVRQGSQVGLFPLRLWLQLPPLLALRPPLLLRFGGGTSS
jgi:hypothetical protein